MARQAKKLVLMSLAFLDGLIRQSRMRFEQVLPLIDSADYKAWRLQFLWRRLGLCLWVALACLFTATLLDLYRVFYQEQAENFPQELKFLEVIEDVTGVVLLLIWLILHKTKWGHRYPAVLCLCLSWSCTLMPQIFATLSGFALLNAEIWGLVFLAQATLIPVCWPLHLGSQVGALVYYVAVNLALGLIPLEGYPLFNGEFFLYMFWFCFICNLSVYLYERLQQAEFEARRELRIFLHAISHDLRTPLMGTAIVFQNLLKKSDDQVSVSAGVLERLLEGNSRHINLINSLQEAYALEVRSVVIHCEPLQLSTLVTSVLCEQLT